MHGEILRPHSDFPIMWIPIEITGQRVSYSGTEVPAKIQILAKIPRDRRKSRVNIDNAFTRSLECLSFG